MVTGLGGGWVGVVPAAAAVLTLAVVAGAPAGAAPVASRLVSGPVRPVACRPLATDPQLQAPLYAQNEGASGAADEWWCELPHATRMLAGYVAVQRDVAPLADDYAYYTTEFARRGAKAGSGPTVMVTDDVESVQDPGALHYGRTPPGRKFRVAKGVTGYISSSDGSTQATWRFPTRGVPRYLQAVATVTVLGNGVSAPTIEAIARSVEPD